VASICVCREEEKSPLTPIKWKKRLLTAKDIFPNFFSLDACGNLRVFSLATYSSVGVPKEEEKIQQQQQRDQASARVVSPKKVEPRQTAKHPRGVFSLSLLSFFLFVCLCR